MNSLDIHSEDTYGQRATSAVIIHRPGIRCQYARRRSAEGGWGEEWEGLGRRPTFQGRGRRNDSEITIRTNEPLKGRIKGEMAAAVIVAERGI